MKSCVRALFLLVVVAVVPCAFGQAWQQDQTQHPDYYGGCDSNMTADECFNAPMANYATCTAVGSNGCAACGNEQYTGLPVCVYNVHYSASCQCSRGSDKYGNPVCAGSGRCTYRP